MNDLFLVIYEVLTAELLKIQVFQLFTPRQPIRYAFIGYSKIPSIWLALDQTDTRLPYILNYQIVSILI